MTAPLDPLIGRTVAHYEVLARLGGGGMGVVYKARDARLGRTVALKFLPPQWSHDDAARQRFVREAQAASATDHRNICTVHDIATSDDGQLFIVMAYYEGPTLKQRLEDGPLPIDEALDIASQIAEGLARAHAQGVVHRDVKPGNLILAEDGVRILDFGLATFADALQLTVTGSTLGTAAYMSPEQVRGEEADARTDVWAVGVILYQMLTGHVPFRGTHHEAIAFAIRNEVPPPIRAARPEVPEEVEQLVFRALHKEKSVRFPSGRELARALRQARGQTLPLDLRTEPVVVPYGAGVDGPRRRRRWPWWAAAAATLIALAGGVGWMITPARVTVAVVPVSNQTGFEELQDYRLALTYALVSELAHSPVVRPVSWRRTHETLQAVVAAGADVTGRDTFSALERISEASLLIVPTLVNDDETWRVRVQIHDRRSATDIATYESTPVASALRKQTAYELMLTAAGQVETHFRRGLWRIWPRRPGSPSSRLSSIDAVRAMERGVAAFENFDYPAAYAAFRDAATIDTQHPLPQAWSSRAARAMRHDADATAAAAAAVARLTDQIREADRAFVEAVAAEAQLDLAAARERYERLVAVDPDDPAVVTELAAFLERTAGDSQGWSEAVTAYLRVLALDPTAVRPRVELCRLYVSLSEFDKAKAEGRRAVSAYQAHGAPSSEAQARFCLVDALRTGSESDRQEALAHADAALAALAPLPDTYNKARARYYRGIVAAEQRNLAEALAYWEPAVTEANDSGNVVLLARLFNVLGVAHQRLGKGGEAADFFQRSADAYGRLRDERGAARQQLNSGSLRIAYGVDADRAVRDVRNALEVMRERGDPDFEVTCLEAIGSHYRHVARYDDAERELTQALNLANQFDLALKIAQIRLQHVRLRIDRSQYAEARALVDELLASGSANTAMQSQLQRGRILTRLGDFAGARASLASVEAELQRRGDDGIRLAFYVAAGELAFESGDVAAARHRFQQAAHAEAGDFVDQAVVDARAYLALLDGLEGGHAGALAALTEVIAKARRMGRVAVEARYRVFTARVLLAAGRMVEAHRQLAELSEAQVESIGPELRAQVSYWRARSADAGAPAGDWQVRARRLIEGIAATLPEIERARYTSRREIAEILQ